MTRPLVIVLMALALAAPSDAKREFVADESDFTCVRDWPKVRNLRVFHHKARKLRKAIRTLEKGLPGYKLPKGTIVQLVPFEAMVKRGGRFNPEGRGWEFFRLLRSPEGTVIDQRGGPEVVNAFTGDSCQGCHGAAPDFDLICEKDHGCVSLPAFVTDEFLQLLQETDARCPPAE
jgi:hypothetical protein